MSHSSHLPAQSSLLNHRYQVLEVLGDGGFGQTFLAEDTQMPSRRKCVVKQLKPITDNPQAQQIVKERFQREAAILERLGAGHPQIPHLYAYFEDNEQFYLVEEWVEGKTLTQVLHQGLLPEPEVYRILVSLLPVLDYVHQHNIVHRDLKPDNIILRHQDRQPVLIDFGAVKETMTTVMSSQGHSSRSIIVGTPGFMPLEQMAGRPIYSSDLYGLGMTAIYLLTGKIPQEFETDLNNGLVLWHPHVHGLSMELRAILDQAIRPNAHDRFATASQMLAALQSGNGYAPTLVPAVAVPSPTMVSPPSSPAAPVNSGIPAQPSTQAVLPPGYPPGYPPSYPPSGYPPGYSPPGYPPSPTAQTVTPNIWKYAVLIGVLIGSSILGGAFFLRAELSTILNQNSTEKPTADNTADNVAADKGDELSTTTPADSSHRRQTPSPYYRQLPPSTSRPKSPPPPSSGAIAQQDAVDFLQDWLVAKRDIFGPSYNRNLLSQFLTGRAYECNLGSLDWLESNGAYYTYDNTQIAGVRNFVANGNQATIDVIIDESRTLYNRSGGIDRGASKSGQSSLRYDFIVENGALKISYFPLPAC
jgi:serine/threonine protein kinase